MLSTCDLGGRRIASHLSLGQWLAPALVAAIIFTLVGETFGVMPHSTKPDGERLVAAAMQADISGEVLKSFALLHDAIRIDPENQLARWQLGQIKVDKQWLTVEEAQRRASADPLQTEYRDRRAAAG